MFARTQKQQWLGILLLGMSVFVCSSCDRGIGPGEYLEPVHAAMLGKPAPDFELRRLDGQKVKLSSHRDKEIVILDMWATWCGPCVAELPLVAEVSAAYQSKGVVTYAVNQGDEEKSVKEFVQSENVTLQVLLDTEGKAGNAYHAEAIPMLVIVGKDGTVQSIHLGYSPALKGVLTRELDQLIAGKNLAVASQPAAK
ncbi:MAG: TlpA family protein disulfide reductase [Planctomycetaceae bacterium]|nr:TlpA family protein disulfide reductase [Planctomycetaceae bacterium]